MKNTVIIFLSFLILSCGSNDSYEIIGEVKNVPDGSIIKLYELYGDMGMSFQADTVVNGGFRFRGSITDSVIDYYLKFPRNSNFYGKCQVWTENKKIFVTGDSRYLANWVVKSKVNEQNTENRFLKETRYLKHSIDSLFEIQDFNKMNNIDDEFLDPKIDSFLAICFEKEFNIISRNPNSLSALKRLKKIILFNKTIPDSLLQSTYESLNTEYKTTIYGKEIQSLLTPVTHYEIGGKINDFKFYDLRGLEYRFSDFKGKYILLDFWSSGCKPCYQSFPELRQLIENHWEHLVIIGLNIDEKKEHWEMTSEREDISWGNFSDRKYNYNSAYKLFGVHNLPTYVLISPESKLLHKWSGYREGIFEDKLSMFLY